MGFFSFLLAVFAVIALFNIAEALEEIGSAIRQIAEEDNAD